MTAPPPVSPAVTVPTTPATIEAMARVLGGPLEVRDVAASELGWNEVPPDARVQEVLREGGQRVALVHARRGRFSATRVFGTRPGPVLLLGVVSDALVFADPANEVLRALTHTTSVKSPLLPAAEYDEPLAGKPRSYAGGVIEWGPFPHAVPTRALDEVNRLGVGRTVILESIDARADGPRTTLVVHPVASSSDADAIQAIAQDLEALRGQYPQLAEFSARTSCDLARLAITCAYHTQEPAKGGGWTAGVPSPDEDGVWLCVDLHDPASTAQIHTQPVVPALHRGPMRVMSCCARGRARRACTTRSRASWPVTELSPVPRTDPDVGS